MARQTRQQRRERRQAQSASAQQRAQERPRLRALAPPTAEEAAPRSGGGFLPFRFVRESAGELKKVEWPRQQQLIQGTIVVLVACIIVGIYLYANDQLWSYVVKHVLTR
jgi:preprotein translocase subunit SecE